MVSEVCTAAVEKSWEAYWHGLKATQPAQRKYKGGALGACGTKNVELNKLSQYCSTGIKSRLSIPFEERQRLKTGRRHDWSERVWAHLLALFSQTTPIYLLGFMSGLLPGAHHGGFHHDLAKTAK